VRKISCSMKTDDGCTSHSRKEHGNVGRFAGQKNRDDADIRCFGSSRAGDRAGSRARARFCRCANHSGTAMRRSSWVFDDKPRRKASRAERGHVAELDSKRRRALLAAGVRVPPKANCEPKRFIKEFRLDTTAVQTENGLVAAKLRDDLAVKVGDQLTVKVFEGVQAVDVTGWTKGRGFSGVMKRWGFSGLGASHGVKRHHRAPGSLSGHATDRGNSGRMKKGKRMAGRYGNERVTIRNLAIVRLDEAHNLLLVKGAVPGPNNGYVIVRPTKKRKHIAHTYEVD
jgi:large subunit ribosomal protein L3